MGCERSTDPPAEPSIATHGTRIAVVGAYENNPQWPGIRGGAQRFFMSVPPLVSDFEAASEETSDSLTATIGRVLKRRPLAVCLQVTDPALARPAAELVLTSQVVLVTFGVSTEDARVARHVDVDWPGGAELLGANLNRIAAGRKSYVLVHDRGRNATTTNIYQRFAAAAQQQYELTLLQEEETDATHSVTQRIEELLSRFTHAGLLVTLNMDAWLDSRAGWNRELRARSADFRFVALSAAPALWVRLGTPAAPGEAAALAGPLDGDIGYAAVQAAARKLFSPTMSFPDPVVRCELVLPEDLGDFAQRYSAAANGMNVRPYLPNVESSQPASAP